MCALPKNAPGNRAEIGSRSPQPALWSRLDEADKCVLNKIVYLILIPDRSAYEAREARRFRPEQPVDQPIVFGRFRHRGAIIVGSVHATTPVAERLRRRNKDWSSRGMR